MPCTRFGRSRFPGTFANTTSARSVIGFPARLPLRDAVLVNAVLVHGLDYDDTHVPGIIHATSSSGATQFGEAHPKCRVLK